MSCEKRVEEKLMIYRSYWRESNFVTSHSVLNERVMMKGGSMSLGWNGLKMAAGRTNLKHVSH